MDLRAAATQQPLAKAMIPNPLKVPEEIIASMQQQIKTGDPKNINTPLENFLKQTVAKGIKNRNLPDFVMGSVPAYGPGLVRIWSCTTL
jgi:hypothetical protein